MFRGYLTHKYFHTVICCIQHRKPFENVVQLQHYITVIEIFNTYSNERVRIAVQLGDVTSLVNYAEQIMQAIIGDGKPQEMWNAKCPMAISDMPGLPRFYFAMMLHTVITYIIKYMLMLIR